MALTKAEMTVLEIAGLRQGLELALEERDTFRLACREFVRMQKELCELLHESDEGDSIGLHDRIVWAIKALREQVAQHDNSTEKSP